jgi:hypothetical protein
MKKINFDTKNFDFKKLISHKFDVDDLEHIHESDDFNYQHIFKRENDQSTHWHKQFYELARTSEFLNLYYDFIKCVIKPLYQNGIVYQAIPTFRLQFPNNIAVGEYHKDKNYRNGDWAAKVKELNYFLPLTRALNTNTIWAESIEDFGDYSPMNAEYGQVIQWDGCNLKHGNKENVEGFTRISMDFRVISKETYIPSNHTTINTKTLFEIGGYYNEM